MGHSDIAPERKKDPGEKFPWKYFSKKKIGLWHDIENIILKKKRGLNTNNLQKKQFIKNLNKIGYVKQLKNNKNKYFKILTKAFQRRFRQELINGLIDQECLIISENLKKKI